MQTWTTAEIVTMTVILALLGLFAVTGFLWAMHLRQHRHQTRNTMRRHKRNVKIFVDSCLSVDVSLLCYQPKVWAEVTLTLDGFTVKGDINMFSLTTDQRIVGHIAPKDAEGRPAGWENMVIASSDETLAKIQPLNEDPDNKLAFQIVSAKGQDFDWAGNLNARPFTVTVDFDGKVGEEVVPVHIDINGELTTRTATQAGVDLGGAED
jgi:hypothetical protein